VELVSVDAMAVYRELDLGTAKPTPEEQAVAPWHLLDVVDPSEEYSVAAFQAEARRAISGIERRGRTAILVGGTGLYHRAVVDDLEFPGRYPPVLEQLELEASEPDGLVLAYKRLAVLDPDAAARIEPGNRRRILRALEVTIGAGRRFSSFGPGLDVYAPSRFRLVGLVVDRTELDRRLEHRFDVQLAAGLLDEVRALSARPAGLSRTARQAIGYRELLDHVEHDVALPVARAAAIRRLRSFARRQESWFRRDRRVTWLAPDEATPEAVRN
jgi:tRNA dimethylallyltransferase